MVCPDEHLGEEGPSHRFLGSELRNWRTEPLDIAWHGLFRELGCPLAVGRYSDTLGKHADGDGASSSEQVKAPNVANTVTMGRGYERLLQSGDGQTMNVTST